MARLAGVDIPDNKRVEISLQYIYGIGDKTAIKMVQVAGIDRMKRVKDLNDEEMAKLRTQIGQITVEGDLRKDTLMNIKRMNEVGCYRGIRHRLGLPARGQRTHTNARTRKGPRKGQVGGIKKKGAAKK